MSIQYGRKVSLIIGDAKGNGLDVSQLRFRFIVKHRTAQTLNTAEIRIWNLSERSAKLINAESTQVVLQAGYEGSYGIIFRGQITLTRTGRESPTDTYVDVCAADSDVAYNSAVVNKALAAGFTPQELYEALCDSMKPYGITAADLPDSVPSRASPRGRVCYGMTRDFLRDFAAEHSLLWSIRNGEITLVPADGFLPGDAIKLNSKTGMLGIPCQTDAGIEVTTLLNPNIVPGRRVQIDEKSINKTTIRENNIQREQLNQAQLPKVARDGFYRVVWMQHHGDTRGNSWETIAICTISGSAESQAGVSVATNPIP